MRNPDRIDAVLECLRFAWKAHPDMRLGQLVGNASIGTDGFFVEDDEMAKRLVAYGTSVPKEKVGAR